MLVTAGYSAASHARHGRVHAARRQQFVGRAEVGRREPDLPAPAVAGHDVAVDEVLPPEQRRRLVHAPSGTSLRMRVELTTTSL